MKNHLKTIELITSKAGKTVPLQRKAFNQGFSFSNLDFKKQLDIWDYIYVNTDDFRTEMFCLYFLEYHIKNRDYMLSSWPIIRLWQDKIIRWETCDQIAKVYGQLVEYDASLILPTYKEWNTSPNLWHRRQSIVGLLYYASSRKHYLPFETIVNLVEPLLGDKTHYVQRGVGWTLKELGKAYPEEQEKFVFKNASKLSSIAYSAGTEKWTTTKREKLKEIRRAARIGK